MFSCLWKMWNWLDSPAMDSKKSFMNQPMFINDVNEHGQFGPVVNSHPNQVQCAVTQTQQKNLINKTTTFVYNQPQNQENNQYAIKQITSHENIKKKSGGNQIQLRCPSAKRPPEAAITKQGWLHKQGAEGLKVWRKRWFVLSDYCLFYYKGPEEEKVLGSILLPSYKVSLCSSDSKSGRKFAFKCEHANMRTYYLAADSQESMNEWVEVIKLACMLQTNVEQIDRQSGPSLSSAHNPVTDNNESGFHQLHTNFHPPHTYPKHAQPQVHIPQNYISNFQPLYANAPPKPRRQNDGGYIHNQEYPPEMYSTPSSSNNTSGYQNNPAAPMQYNAHYCSRSPVNIYRNCDNVPLPQYVNHNQLINRNNSVPIYYMQYPHMMSGGSGMQSSERRTPDTYGRSKQSQSKGKDASDYEDIYTDEVMYKRPLSPIAYSNIKKISPVSTIPVLPIHRPYTLFNIPGPQRPNNIIQNNHMHTPKSRYHDGILPNVVPRPHSADFLEYEFKQRENDMPPVKFQQPRPKSSLDITSSDSFYYSKESYADKMRKSSSYLQHYTAPRIIKPEAHLRSQRPMFDTMPKINFVPKSFSESHNIGMLGDCTPPHLCPSPYNPSKDTYETLQYKRSYADNQSRDYLSQYSRDSSNTLDWSEKSSRSFLDSGPSHRDNERRREESMKRLLEWKQRMLQSPLNRKLPNHLTCTDLYKQYPTLPHARQQSYANSYSSDDEASGSISLNAHDTFPREKEKRLDGVPRHSYYNMINSHEDCYMPSSQSVQDLNLSAARKGRQWNENIKMNVSAGELLGRTHEELVLLLIQLRRQSTNTCHAIEACYQEIDNLQLQLNGMDPQTRLESLKKLEQLKQHLLDLEKQYEKGKPLVNLVDNMVKLGSLYRSPNDHGVSSYVRDRLEFNQQMQEKRLLAEERRDWNRLSPNHIMLQAKVQQLYQLDKLLQEESETLQGLQQDKEKIERALGNLRYKLNLNQHNPREFEQARKQQLILEKELSKVHQMLAYNSKKLEETVAGNARLEQELLVLRQKLQMTNQLRNSPQFSSAGDSLPCAASSSALLESELHRVQQLVGDLQRQRQELSLQVRQLTDRSHSLSEQVYTPSVSPVQSLYSSNKKRSQTYWRETDLDTMQNIDHGINSDMLNKPRSTPSLYDEKNDNYSYYVKPSTSCIQISNEDYQNLGGSMQEKQEIKTVRIVKRESERRQRDREKTGGYGGAGDQHKWDLLMEESEMSTNPFQMPVRDIDPIIREPPITDHMMKYFSPVNSCGSSLLNREASVSSPSLPQTNKSYSSHSLSATSTTSMDKSPALSPVFKSKAARQIINEMSGQQGEEPSVKCSVRRLIPKEKRRHYTAPDNSLIKSLNQLSSNDEDVFESKRRRARDDLDMERALRQRTDTPDVVRSTLSNKELKYNENTIESLLGTPNKISIPERYIPEKLPQLSPEEEQHRLRKVESIKKMLTDTTIIPQHKTPLKSEGEKSDQSSTASTSKIVEEKRQREHLLQLNQILAKQVMEMSKIVAVKALASLPLEESEHSVEEEDLSPVTPLPLYQQRDNFYT